MSKELNKVLETIGGSESEKIGDKLNTQYVRSLGIELEGQFDPAFKEKCDNAYDYLNATMFRFNLGTDGSVERRAGKEAGELRLRDYTSNSSFNDLLNIVDTVYNHGDYSNDTSCGTHVHFTFELPSRMFEGDEKDITEFYADIPSKYTYDLRKLKADSADLKWWVDTFNVFSLLTYEKPYNQFIAAYKEKFKPTRGESNKFLKRLSNSYCKADYNKAINGDRYSAINLESYPKYGTIEIRLLPNLSSFREFKNSVQGLIDIFESTIDSYIKDGVSESLGESDEVTIAYKKQPDKKSFFLF